MVLLMKLCDALLQKESNRNCWTSANDCPETTPVLFPLPELELFGGGVRQLSRGDDLLRDDATTHW